MAQPGLLIAQDGTSIQQGLFVYDSRNKHMQVNLLADPPHVQVYTVQPTAIATSSGTPNWFASETLATIKHNLPYRPRVFGFCYIYSYDGAFTDSSVGQYGEQVYFGFGAIDDYMYVVADDTNVYIKHDVQDYFNLGYTSTATHQVVKVKILICSNPYNRVLT